MSNRLSGIPTLNYLGTDASSPPNVTFHRKDPLATDYQNFSIGDFWINTVDQEIWVLLSRAGFTASWVQIGTGGAGIDTINGDTSFVSGNIVSFLAAQNGTPRFVGNGTTTMSFNLFDSDANIVLSQIPSVPITGQFNTSIGFDSLVAFGSGAGNTALGSEALAALTSGDTNIAVGYGSLALLTTGERNISVGAGSGGAYTGAESDNILINNFGMLGESNTIRIGTDGGGAGTQTSAFIAGVFGVTPSLPSPEVVIIDSDGQLGTGGGTFASQYDTDSGTAIPSVGILNIVGTHGINTAGASNIVSIAIDNAITLGDVVAIPSASPALTLDSGDLEFTGDIQDPITNQFIRFPSGNIISFFLNNIFMGQGAGNITMTPGVAIFNIGIGPFALESLTTGVQNVGIGNAALQEVTTGQNNVALGYVAAGDLTTGSNNIAIGSQALNPGVPIGLTTGSHNVAIGGNAGSGLTTNDSNNLFISASSSSLGNGQAGENGVIRIVSDIGTGFMNMFIGQQAGNNSYTAGVGSAENNVGIGAMTLQSLTTGDSATAIGQRTCANLTTAEEATAIGAQALDLLTTGNFNTALGGGALRFITTGDSNTVIGNKAGFNYATGTESSNILVGASVNGVNGENNTIRIGNSGAGTAQQNRCFIAGIRGITTGVNDAVAVLIDSAGQLGTTSSSARYKKNIEDMSNLSNDIYKLRVVSFDYKNSTSEFKSVGLIAEEVEQVMPSLVVRDVETGNPETVKYHDLVPMLLNEIQKLSRRIEILEKKGCK